MMYSQNPEYGRADELDFDARDADAGIGRAVTLCLAEALAAALLEDPDLRSTLFAVDNADDLGACHVGSAGDHLAAVLFEEKDAVDGDLRARFRLNAIDRDGRAGRDPDLAATALNNCEHVRTLQPPPRGGYSPPAHTGRP